MADDSLILPESVAAYIREAQIRAAVTTLLATRADKITIDEWSDAVPFYSAFSGAQIVRSDWAIARRWLLRCLFRLPPGENEQW